jgi:hypothetical protein
MKYVICVDNSGTEYNLQLGRVYKVFREYKNTDNVEMVELDLNSYITQRNFKAYRFRDAPEMFLLLEGL